LWCEYEPAFAFLKLIILESGRISRLSVKLHRSSTVSQTRATRRNAAKQQQLKKRHELIEAMRIFSGVDGAPRVVAVIPLCPDVSAREVVRAMMAPLESETLDVPKIGLFRTAYVDLCMLFWE
jgi:pre-rRNA-processing protein TSR1